MNVLNERVQHIEFGEGIVIDQQAGKMSIRFSEKFGIKQFIYPDAFEKYLKLNNSDIELSVLEELNDNQAKIQAEKLRKRQEQEEANRLRALEKVNLAAQKRKTTAKSKVTKPKAKKNTVVSETSEENNV